MDKHSLYSVTDQKGRNLPVDLILAVWCAVTEATKYPGWMAEHHKSKSTGGFYYPVGHPVNGFLQMTVVLTWRAVSRLFGGSGGDLAFSAMQRRVLSKSASTSSTVFPMISRAAGLFRYGANFRNLPRITL